MCKLLVHEERYEEAQKVLKCLPADIGEYREVSRLRDLIGFFLEVEQGVEVSALQQQIAADENNIRARQQLVARHVQHRDFEAALVQLAEIMGLALGVEDNYAQKAMLRLFNILGNEHELSTRFRPNLRRYTH